jgi:XTP/dITP diphosphohydrolase
MSEPLTVVLATANPDKATEIRQILLDELGSALSVLARPGSVPEVEEIGETLEANARLKANAVSQATGLPSVADDTGLLVSALDNDPGVRSARYAGAQASYDDNVRKLLGALSGTKDRAARFSTVAILRFPDGRELMAEGTVHGVIGDAPMGSGGFGYDPVFIPMEGGGRTFAEMPPSEKSAISHRGRAFRALARQLAEAGDNWEGGRPT